MNDVARIAFVTGHFEELKGLKLALYGAGWLFSSLLLLSAVASNTEMPQPLIGQSLAGILFTFGFFELEPRYRNTFGIVGHASVAAALRSFGIVIVFAILFGPVADQSYQMHHAGPSVAAVAIAMTSALVVLRDWRWRIHYLIPFASGIVGAILTGSAPAGGIALPFGVEPHRASAFLVAYALLGFGLIAAGLLDHVLLATTMRPPTTDDVPRTWQRTRLTYVVVAALISFGAAGTLDAMAPKFVAMTLFMVSISVAFFASIGVMIFDSVRRGKRTWLSANGAKGFVVAVGQREAACALAVSLAALFDVVFVPGARPVTTALVFGVVSLAVAMHEPRANLHYLLGAAAGLGVLPFLPRFAPAQSFALFVCAVAGSLAIEWGIDLIHELKHAHAV